MSSPVAKQVSAANRRARERGLVGSLTALDWQRSLDHFDHRCAYCGGIGRTIDHFQSMSLGGQTSMSNCVPSCPCCNEHKGSHLPDELDASFVSPEQLTVIRTYLEVIGQRNQENWRRLCAREPAFAEMHEKRQRLRAFCFQHAREASKESMRYGFLHLCVMLFGVEWDPTNYFQVLTSLSWQKLHTTLPEVRAACEDVEHFLVQLNRGSIK